MLSLIITVCLIVPSCLSPVSHSDSPSSLSHSSKPEVTPSPTVINGYRRLVTLFAKNSNGSVEPIGSIVSVHHITIEPDNSSVTRNDSANGTQVDQWTSSQVLGFGPSHSWPQVGYPHPMPSYGPGYGCPSPPCMSPMTCPRPPCPQAPAMPPPQPIMYHQPIYIQPVVHHLPPVVRPCC
ncbi:hypothetical protein HDE_07364 [Halotydeus destructor]|nr:hypothetical protein HDE_07364 [Halotydeus destructor]